MKYRPQVLEAPASTNKSAYLNLLDAEKSFADLEIGLADDRRPSGGRGHRNVQLKKYSGLEKWIPRNLKFSLNSRVICESFTDLSVNTFLFLKSLVVASVAKFNMLMVDS